ncbi:uncharacterized protein CTRU02_210871 [Colletotrichum truncatum]|uniref:Uncharacterized protein n=1 Tax=Colletotrichum truncatum TaxID=5467 RepID=A0ACC3YQE6_COLTU|nr:uncharacterized protein CTRU02_03645 [Colletotrichum truncatum]KAF6796667.1 hypothetical protein CTRU02_03645 [Colletotrichum truncatum]
MSKAPMPHFPNFQKRPLAPDLKELYQRAIDDSTALTPAELHRILRRPPPEEEDQICRDRTGLTRQQIIAKALTEPETLSKTERQIIAQGVLYDSSDMSSAWYVPLLELESEDRELAYSARGKAKGALGNEKDEDTALENVMKLSSARAQEAREKRRRAKEQEREALEACRALPRPRWIQELLDAGYGDRRWGFVCFRTAYEADGVGDEIWDRFKTLYHGEIAKTVLVRTWKRDGPKLYDTHESLFISAPELDGMSGEDLRSKFRLMRSKGEIPKEMRLGCLLVADAGVLKAEWLSEASPFPNRNSTFIKAMDPDYEVASERVEGGFAGEIKMPLHKVFDWLHYTLFAKSETWEQRYVQTKQRWALPPSEFCPYPVYHVDVMGMYPWAAKEHVDPTYHRQYVELVVSKYRALTSK